jgi:hypothetical protein
VTAFQALGILLCQPRPSAWAVDFRAFGPPSDPLPLDISGAISAPSRRLEKDATLADFEDTL